MYVLSYKGMCLTPTNGLCIVCLATSFYCGGFPDPDFRPTQPVGPGFRDPPCLGWREFCFVSIVLLLRAVENAEGEEERGAG